MERNEAVYVAALLEHAVESRGQINADCRVLFGDYGLNALRGALESLRLQWRLPKSPATSLDCVE